MNEPLIIACDIDGVLCEGPYLPFEERTVERYAAMRPYEEAIGRFRAERPVGAVVYYVTSRRRHLWRTTLAWLHKHVEPNAQLIAGIDPDRKAVVAGQLGCRYLFDDDPETAFNMTWGCRVFTVYNPSRYNPSRSPDDWDIDDIGQAWGSIALLEEETRRA